MKKKEGTNISCWMVRASKIVPKDKKQLKRDLKLQIECGEWYFPCESYSFKTIKETLERAICEVLNLESVEVKSFQTNIVEYP